jgi:hypothetical protein
MKKLFAFMFFLSLCTGVILQAQSQYKHDYKGNIMINNDTVASSINAYKYQILYDKALELIKRDYKKSEWRTNGENIKVIEPDYVLVLEFYDGMYGYCFTDTIFASANNSQLVQELRIKEEIFINKLTQYIKTNKN